MTTSAQGFAVVTGFTTPTSIYEKMRTIDRAAGDLNRDILTNVAEGGYRSAWRAWFAQWQAFFSKTFNEKVGNVFRTDELDQEVDFKASEFEGFRKSYPQQKRPDGSPVPPSSQPAPIVLPKPGKEGGSTLPWYFWVGVTVAAAGLGYVGYLKYHELKAKRQALEKDVLPGVLGGFFGPKTGGALAKAAAARDPELSLALAKDPGALARYQAFAYRPYDHPHVVPVKAPLPSIASAVGNPEPYNDPFGGRDPYPIDRPRRSYSAAWDRDEFDPFE